MADIRDAALAEPGVHDVQVRVREEGHVFHAEVFIVSTAAGTLGLEDSERVRGAVRDVDWKLHYVVVSPVRGLPIANLPPRQPRDQGLGPPGR